MAIAGSLMRRRLGVLAAYLVLVAAGFAAGRLVPMIEALEPDFMGEAGLSRLLAGVVALYVAASAVPFVPGAEIGLGLLLAFGKAAAPVVYGAMVGALGLAFLAGRLVPATRLARVFLWLGLKRAAALVRTIAPMDAAERESYLAKNFDNRWIRGLLRRRYLALALALNLPGNAILGGGGGLALFAGMSGLFSAWAFGLTIILAVAPVPLAFALAG